ncbi:hypothetical protein K461DRAFT_3514 [Myriangium duriaei CBS 260.36]|uniref:Secreted protein n=1 Tax=Myriangium duriaei CBS 260.36 TaxID=1168546 RepID=A0A9P4MJ51_9PEZI|nr:hypothetical protein K461DRAFT_3514 [Myriangium duriaei CBS 260.36]
MLLLSDLYIPILSLILVHSSQQSEQRLTHITVAPGRVSVLITQPSILHCPSSPRLNPGLTGGLQLRDAARGGGWNWHHCIDWNWGSDQGSTAIINHHPSPNIHNLYPPSTYWHRRPSTGTDSGTSTTRVFLSAPIFYLQPPLFAS